MLRLASSEVFNSVLAINTTNDKFKRQTGTIDEFSFTRLKDELEETPNIPNITSEHPEDDMIIPRIYSTFKKLETGKRHTDGYYMLLIGYARSPFREFESYLRIVVGLDENNFQLILKQNDSNFVTYDLSPRIYSIKDIEEAVYNMADHEGTLQYEYDDIALKT